MVKAAFALAAAAGGWAMLPLGRRRFQWPMLLGVVLVRAMRRVTGAAPQW